MCDISELRAPILACDSAKEREKYFFSHDDNKNWSPPHRVVENLENPLFLIDLYRYLSIIGDTSLWEPSSHTKSVLNDHHLVCDQSRGCGFFRTTPGNVPGRLSSTSIAGCLCNEERICTQSAPLFTT